MYSSQGFSSACSPPAQIFQEEICGDLNSPDIFLSQFVWHAPSGDYLQGTFEIFNAASSLGPMIAAVQTTTGSELLPLIQAGNSISLVVLNPIIFQVDIFPPSSGTFCITLYKYVPD